jgi:2-oxo-3-(phosphooxy)propyl 3-oxoalkanoate synthase
MTLEKISTRLCQGSSRSINERSIDNNNNLVNIELDRSVLRDFAHKKLPENVYITSIRQISKTEFVCGAIIPQLQPQSIAVTSKPAENILLLSEIGRQVVLACAHYSGVPLDFAFVLKQITSELQLDNLLLLRNCTIDEIEIRAIVDREIDRTSAQLKFFYRDKLIVQGHGEGCFMPYDRYLRLRTLGRRKQFSSQDNLLPLPDKISWRVHHERCSSNRWFDASVLEFSGNPRKAIDEATLIVDEQNSFFFDRYCDHVPGILIFQGFNQLASRYYADLTPSYIAQAELNFYKFAELNYPVKLNVVNSNSISLLESRIELEATQNSHLLARSTLTVSNLSSGG